MSVNRDPSSDEYDSFLNDVVNSIYEDKEIGRLVALKEQSKCEKDFTVA